MAIRESVLFYSEQKTVEFAYKSQCHSCWNTVLPNTAHLNQLELNYVEPKLPIAAIAPRCSNSNLTSGVTVFVFKLELS
jgi:hypothetical protein